MLTEKEMNEENQENEELSSPVIFTIPASLTVPGFGFLVALNPDWCFEEINRGSDSSRMRRRPVRRPFSRVFDDSWS